LAYCIKVLWYVTFITGTTNIDKLKIKTKQCYKTLVYTFHSCTLHKCQLSKTFIGGAVCREFESEVPAAEEMLDRVVCSSEEFSFQTCLESGDGSGSFCNWRQQLVPSY